MAEENSNGERHIGEGGEPNWFGAPEPKGNPGIGNEMPDGSVYAGISPDTGRPMYTTPADAPLTYTFNEAVKYARQLNAQKVLGHDDWRMPTKGELNVLFHNRAAIAGFDESGSHPTGWYWSSSQYDYFIAGVQRFNDGGQSYNARNLDSSVRCVRG